ncbi:MAG: glycosyltransferase family 2 protein [Thiotrichales bacterium]|jgi:glycosyltransferase involved in cell wall biosynthesis|nr:glycosyltransferase family 2 protein [Gammaproteobacteria bacterium]MBT4607368.1 glycosyltransferase family 2 protein [Thiotrichales bacterium]MBT7913446.1 glycosyltransferase family 2 protein [Candidatus Bathyarchaeota archaeon]
MSVSILLASYNGEAYIEQQIQSIFEQSFQDWSLTISDDGSTDRTIELVEPLKGKSPNTITLKDGPKQGFVSNFLSLACSSELNTDYYAFCDQDDIWLPGKLQRAVDWLKSVPDESPALYCSRTRLINENGQACGLSPLFPRPPSFQNALVQSIAGGNSMVFNRAARELLQLGGANAEVPSHDWWSYLLVTSFGGQVFYDTEPSLLYRQHDNNEVGANRSLWARALRVQMLLQGRFYQYSEANFAALEPLKERMDEEHSSLLEQFKVVHSAPLMKRLRSFLQGGFYRQTPGENLMLAVAVLLNKI